MKRIKVGDRIEIGECQVTIRNVICCGVLLWWAELPNHSACCSTASHRDGETALECAQTAIAKGIHYSLHE